MRSAVLPTRWIGDTGVDFEHSRFQLLIVAIEKSIQLQIDHAFNDLRCSTGLSGGP